MWLGAMLLLLGTVGVLVTTRIALAVLIALGPVFVVMALFAGTRGLFVGWLKGVVLLAIAPLFAVLGGSLMLELAVPVINSLAPTPGEIDARAAMAFFMIGAVHVALMFLVMRTATTMVTGWNVFGLVRDASDAQRTTNAPMATAHPHPAPPHIANAPAAPAAQPGLGAQRSIAISGLSTGIAANDTNGQAAANNRSTTHIVTTGDRRSNADQTKTISRARGIGSRFRAASHRPTEKIR